MLSSKKRTSLNRQQRYYENKGYNVQYIEYRTGEDPTDEIVDRTNYYHDEGHEVVVVGHSLGGHYVNQAQNKNSKHGVKYVTVNSPFAQSDSQITHIKSSGDWTNIIQLILDPKVLAESETRWFMGGHSVTQSQGQSVIGEVSESTGGLGGSGGSSNPSSSFPNTFGDWLYDLWHDGRWQ